jgi:hypothetical protein
MAKVLVTAELEFSEAFDHEDLRGLFHSLLELGRAQGLLDFAETNPVGDRIKFVKTGWICPVWQD